MRWGALLESERARDPGCNCLVQIGEWFSGPVFSHGLVVPAGDVTGRPGETQHTSPTVSDDMIVSSRCSLGVCLNVSHYL